MRCTGLKGPLRAIYGITRYIHVYGLSVLGPQPCSPHRSASQNPQLSSRTLIE